MNANPKEEEQLRDQNLRFHERHIDQFRRLLEYLGNVAQVSRSLGRADSYIANILSDKVPSYLRPGDFYAVTYLAQKRF